MCCKGILEIAQCGLPFILIREAINDCSKLPCLSAGALLEGTVSVIGFCWLQQAREWTRAARLCWMLLALRR